MNGLAMLGVWSCVAAAVALIVGWSDAMKWANANAALSSWVQALGSIAAIAIAVWVVQRQHRLEVRRQAIIDWQSRRSLMQGALQLVSGVQQVAAKVAGGNVRRNADDLAHLSIELETLLNALGRTDYLRFETHVAIEALTVTESLGRTVVKHANDAYSRYIVSGSLSWEEVSARATECARGVDVRAKALFASIEAMEPPR